MTTETTFRWLILVLLAGLFAMRLFFMIKVRSAGGLIMPDKGAIRREGGQGIFILRVAAFFTLMAMLASYVAGLPWMDIFRFVLPDWLRWMGFGLGVLSMAFMTWTQISLGTQWSAQLQLTKNHQLITSGPYAWMRHPLYTSVFGWGASLSLLTANWLFIVVTVLSVIGLIMRIPKEEQMMIEAFGDEYKAYKLRTGRLIPKIRK
jgi:protein-S-isoprenylcysteine O-methyltransferase Ste14